MKILSSLVLSLCSVLAYSQTILYQQESTSRTVQDPQTVVLAQGFKATSSTSNPFIAKIGLATENSGGGPTDSNAGANNPSGTTQTADNKFHDTKGVIEVNGTGQLQFTLPIELPSSARNVGPQISLVYTSGAGNGIAGYGWNISGLSSISRVGKNIEKDGEVKGIKLDYSDYYSLNGDRLILKSGEYGKDGAEYVTEKYSNVKIRSLGMARYGNQPLNKPATFEVTFEDGSMAWYGVSPNSGLIIPFDYAITPVEYYLTSWKDNQGNYIDYKYTQNNPNNVATISSIKWGGNKDLNIPHYNTIEFNYADRLLKEQSFTQGVEHVQTNILKDIVVNSNSQQYKKYKIDYKTDTNGTEYQFVDKITEANSENEDANPIIFQYEESKLGGWKASKYDYTEDHKVIGDFDGDGKIDMLKYSSAVNYCKKYDTQINQNPSASETEISYTYYDDTKCIEWVNEPAGFYLFKNIFDDNKPDKILVASDITKESLDKALAIVVKDNNNIVNSKQSIVIFNKNKVGNTQAYDMEFKVYTFSDNNTLDFQFSRSIPYTQYAADPTYSFDNNTIIESQIKEVDINGDGLSELIIGLRDRVCYSDPIDPIITPGGATSLPPGGGTTCNNFYRYLRVSLDKNVSNDNSFASFSLNPANSPALNNYLTGDFNGDSKTDFLRLSNGNPILVSLKDDGQNVSVEETNMGTTSISGVFASAVLGDYNGDGKTDLMVPTGYDSSDWRLYTSTGSNFNMKYFSNFCYFTSSQNDPNNYVPWYSFQRAYIAQDINKDGKSDFIEFFSLVQISQAGAGQSRFVINLYENRGYKTNSGIEFQKKKLVNYTQSSSYAGANLIENKRGYPYWYNNHNTYFRTSMEQFTWSDVKEHYIPLFGSFRVNVSDENILVYQKSRLFKFNYYDVSKESRIKSITQGKVKTDIDYKELDPSTDPNFYKPVKKEQHPYIELNKVYQTSLVSQLRVAGKKQDFRYRGFISHLEGRGMLGFRQVARSTWYADGFENTKIWSGTEMDPLLDGVPIKEWSIKTNNENQIFPTDISENNTALLSFNSTGYQIDKLLNGQVVTTIPPTEKSKVVTAIAPKTSISKNFLTNVLTTKTITYNSYYLPTESVTNINNGFAVSTIKFGYTNNFSGVGKDYFVGRPLSKLEKNTVYSSSNKKDQYFTYENNLLKSTLSIVGTDFDDNVAEENKYDGFGNVTEVKVTNGYDQKSKVSSTEYDPQGRFVIKKTDNLGLQTTAIYNNAGQVTKQTNPLGTITENEYDKWGKILKSKSNTEGTTTYQYTRLDGDQGIKTIEYNPDGDQTVTYTNILGQNYKTSIKAFAQGQFTSKIVEFDILGRKNKESEPYFEGQNPSKWNITVYDDSVYPTKINAIAFTGKEMSTTISGSTTTIKEINGNNRTITKTADAIGNIISSTDKGGTITFSYNSMGQQIKAQYAENIVQTKYDIWGRKTEFNDPSNGIYKYEYNGFGQITKITSPKGTKEYIYNDFGQLITQKENSTLDGGLTTNKSITFNYDDKGRIITKTGTSKGKPYASTTTYDPLGRVLAASESSNGKYYMKKGITYDDKGRVISYEKSLYSSGVMTKVDIVNVYNDWNGELYQLKDKNSGKVLWTLLETNTKGQVVKANLGRSRVFNQYDNNDYLTSIDHQYWLQLQGAPSILQIEYSFDALKNELTNRKTKGDITINESFDYDDNNRLVSWTDPVTNIKSPNRNVYDTKGRILENDQIGKIKFDNASKIYQPTGMTLNSAGTQNYNNDLIQSIIYNENNDPVFIDGEKGDAAFQYGLTSMRQRVTYGGNFNADGEGKFTKFYSEDGSYEILKDNTTGKEKHILYIGGGPYESNIIYLKDYNNEAGSYKFLHKDYLGSILAISDEAGSKLEQRHYDAWGNFTHLKIGAGAVITDKNTINNTLLLVDRGYTSHEHFSEIGIIHMNGRLYDPLLRRFLNADENIQDPYNTQNYNKYGYVLNNPLMYNDPSGEVFQFLIAAGVAVFWATVLTGAIISSAIATFLYLAKAYLTKNFSVGGFLKAVTLGSITGAVTAGLGQVFSAGTFLASVGNGALAGAGGGAIQAIASGSNFLEGITKGAIIGGVTAAATYGLGKLFTSVKKVKYQTSDVNPSAEADVADATKMSYDRETTDSWIDSNYKQKGQVPLPEGYKGYQLEAPKGFSINDKGQFQIKPGFVNTEGGGLAYAITDPKTNIIYLSPSAYNSEARLALSFSHELGHVQINASEYLSSLAHIPIKTGHSSLDNIGHMAIRYNEWSNANLNGFSGSYIPKGLQSSITSSLNFFQQKAPSYYWKIMKLVEELKPLQVRTFKF